MNDLGNLLQLIYDLLSGWYNAFTDHAVAVLAKLDLIEDDTSSIKNSASDIKNNTDDIKDNTGAIITPVQSIKTNSDSIKTDTTSIKNNVSTMTNQLGTISTNVGTASAFTEDVANNTLDIKDRIVTIGSDTTQLRSNSNTITSDVADIKTALNYYLSSTPVTEDVEGAICNIDTDISDYLQLCKVTIPADLTGYTGITLTKCGKNLAKDFYVYSSWKDDVATVGDVPTSNNNRGYVLKTVPGRKYSISFGLNNSNIPSYVYLCKTDGLTSTRIAYITTGGSIQNSTYTFTADNSIYYIRSGNMLDLNSFNTQISKISFCQFEESNVVTSYEAYKDVTYPVSFGSTITDGAEVDLLEGLIKINSTPVSYQSITPIAVRTYKGVNNIYSDIGTTALTYRETLKHYMDKQEA